MTDEPLDSAVRALRNHYGGQSAQAAQTEEQILARLAPRRELSWHWPLSLAALFIGSTAWAGSQGHLGDWVQETFFAAAAPTRTPDSQVAARSLSVPSTNSPPAPLTQEPEPSSQPAAPSPLQAELVPPLPSEPPPHGQEEQSETDQRQVDTSQAPSAQAPKTPNVQPASTPAPAPPVPRSDAESSADTALSIYQRAHQSHFVSKDYLSALRGWEHYLRVAPAGPLALEARYNRALALLHLGRKSEAQAALEPFVRGQYGGYRQQEAQQLTDYLEGPPKSSTNQAD